MLREVKFLHCADNHLDAPFTSLEGSEGSSSLRRQDLKDTFSKIIELARSEEIELLLISGDLYEHNYVKKSTINFINDMFKSIPNTKVVLVPGNHDPYIVNSFYKNFSWNENVYILTELNPYVIFETLKVCVFGVGFTNFFEEKALEFNIKPIYPDYINILMLHGTVDLDFKQSVYNKTDSENLNSLGMDYIALGHFHNRIDNIGGYGTIFNPGSPEPLGFDEPGDHGIIFGTLSKQNTGKAALSFEFQNLNKRYYENLEVNINGFNTQEQVLERILETLDSEERQVAGKENKNGLLCITLKGYVESGFKIDTVQLQVNISGKVFYLKVKDETTADYNFDEILKEPGLRGLFTKKIFEKLENTDSEYERKLLMKALYYGLEALDTGRVEIN